ncbi:MAG: nucleotidyltransferase family protein [Planctomycetota bacterium]
MDAPGTVARRLRLEADRLLVETGLMNVLARYGTATATGSYVSSPLTSSRVILGLFTRTSIPPPEFSHPVQARDRWWGQLGRQEQHAARPSSRDPRGKISCRERPHAMTHGELLKRYREDIRRIAAHHGAFHLRVFGSVARGEAGPESDLDLLIELEQGRSLLDQIGFQQDLEDLLGIRVQVVVEGGISPHLRDHVLATAEAL